jgi:hypothetical protein
MMSMMAVIVVSYSCGEGCRMGGSGGFLAALLESAKSHRNLKAKEPSMADTKTYSGSCHCGHVRYEVQADLSKVMACNCSICTKRGSLLASVPEGQFSLVSDGDDLTDYQFNRKVIHHLFCPTCGVASFARGIAPDGSKMVAINVRCLDGVDLDALNLFKFDGRSL